MNHSRVEAAMVFSRWYLMGAIALFSLCGTGIAGPLSLAVGESRVVAVLEASRAVLGNPAVASLSVLGDGEILVTGRAPGSTHLAYHTKSGRQNRVIQVEATDPRHALIEIQVEVLEVDTQSALKAGLNWGSLSTQQSLQDNLTVSEKTAPPLLKIGELERESVAASLQFLMDRGKARLLARPKLLVAGGEEASFLAGGELPYVTENKNGGTNVEFKPYGVKLHVRPKAEEGGRIRARIRSELSSLDLQNGVSVSGTTVPALRTRWAETTVSVRAGATMVLAGLIQESSQMKTSGLPLLSDIPVLGALFRTTHAVKGQTELVIFLTPSFQGRSAE